MPTVAKIGESHLTRKQLVNMETRDLVVVVTKYGETTRALALASRE